MVHLSIFVCGAHVLHVHYIYLPGFWSCKRKSGRKHGRPRASIPTCCNSKFLMLIFCHFPWRLFYLVDSTWISTSPRWQGLKEWPELPSFERVGAFLVHTSPSFWGEIFLVFQLLFPVPARAAIAGENLHYEYPKCLHPFLEFYRRWYRKFLSQDNPKLHTQFF